MSPPPPDWLQGSFLRTAIRDIFALLALTWIAGLASGQDRVTRFIQPGQPQEVFIAPGEETRWVCATPARAIVWFFAATADPAAKADLRIRSAQGATGNPVWVRSGGAAPGAEAVVWAESTDGVLPFRIWAETEAEFDPSEPNDSFRDAAPLSAEGNRFFLYPKADQDWFFFTVTQPAEYQLIVVVPRGGSVFHDGLELGVSDAAERPLVQRLGQVDGRGTWRTIPFELKPGEYRCWIRARGERSSRFPLTVRLEQVGVNSSPPATPVVAPAPRQSSAPPEVLPPAQVTAPEPIMPQKSNSLWPILLLAFLVGMLVWWGAALMRPRRVFDLTR